MSPSDRDWPRCACGCGEPVPARKANCKARGYKKGEPCKYVAGHANRPRTSSIEDGKKWCASCSTRRPLEDFNKCRSRPHGLDAYCRECMAARHRKYHRENRKLRAQRERDRKAKNPEAERERQRLRMAEWREKNRERHLVQARIYASAYRARKRNQFVEHVDPEVIWERDKGICGICGDPIEGRFDVDHIVPLVKGGEHSYANTQAAHPTCNYRKRDRIVGKDTHEQEVLK